ncbi:HIT family protein [Candidatus Woesearchaeota archaeon]|jgi:diadenosine tetraphosphate (Ap4A) HIT family hydrolase|nr:HIT family protein [Candidatus Woesearchaeota archaeon]MBT6518464.1 HIT family protein [Candidatus Woesearchaeota archaeon]MBT7366843.1 HIT family protein [Candidatus Woesearchaeota archaeon]
MSDEIKGEKLYEDDLVVAVIPEKPAVKGHIQILTKKKYPCFEKIPNKEIEHLFYTASFASTALFENLQPGGTNILFDTGSLFNEDEQRLVINILARNPDDGLNFLWNPKQLAEPDMNQAQEKIKDKCSMIGVDEKKPEVLDLDKQKPETIGGTKDGGAKGDVNDADKPAIPIEEDKYEKEYKCKQKEKEVKEDKESYLVRQLRRVP